MITTEQFSKKLFLVIVLLIGLQLFKAAYPLIATLILIRHDTSNTYTVLYYTGNLLFGIILVLQQRMQTLITIALIALALFYPVFAAILYLITLITPVHEQ
jgi:hypothetical protein